MSIDSVEEGRTQMKNLLLCSVTALLALTTFACSGQKEVKSPDMVDANAQASASTAQQSPLTPAEEEANRKVPPAPGTVEPSKKAPVVEVIVDGVTRPVQDGEVFMIEEQRMLFFYSEAAAADCSNVSVTGLVRRSLAGLCQIGFLPLEQGFKPGDQKSATIKVTTESGESGAYVTRTFRVGVPASN